MKSSQIWYFQMYCSLLTSNYHFSPITSNYHFLMQVWNLIFSNVLFATDFQLSLLHAKVWSLKFTSVMCSIELLLSLLHVKVWNVKFSSVIFSTNVRLPLFNAKSEIWYFQMYCSLLTSNYHFYMLKYEIHIKVIIGGQ